MTDNPSQDAGDPSDEQELDPSELSDEELRAYFTGGVSEETPESTESETETQEVAEAGNTAEEPDDSVTEEEQEAERLAKMRVRPRDDVDQQILDLYKSEGFHGTLADATAVIKGTSEKPQPETTSETQEIDKAAELKAKIAELQDKAKSASEDLDTAQTFELQNQIMEHRLALMKVETDAERAIERQQAEADKARLDFELVRLMRCGEAMKAGVHFHPSSPYAQICADVVVIQPTPPPVVVVQPSPPEPKPSVSSSQGPSKT